MKTLVPLFAVAFLAITIPPTCILLAALLMGREEETAPDSSMPAFDDDGKPI